MFIIFFGANLIYSHYNVADVKFPFRLYKGVRAINNVYGGGNNAEVTGDTNVTIGKKNE